MKKGLYEIFVMLMFISIILISVFIWVGVSGKINLLKIQASEARLSTIIAKEAYANMTACHGSSVFKEDLMNTCTQYQFVKAVRVFQPALDGCEEKKWFEQDYQDAVKNTQYNIYPFWVSIKQNDSYNVCLSELQIVI